MRRFLAGLVAIATLAAAPVSVGQDVPPGAPETPPVDPARAYLFAHMTKARYGVLYYSVSLDGLHWKQLNGGRPVSADYHGHASIARGPDGRYFLVGNKSDDDPLIRFWVSADLIRWTPYGTYRPELKGIAGLPGALQRIGAPKLYFDAPSGQFLLTWHTPNVPGSDKDPERYWASQRTLYVQSKDLKTFDAAPRRLFDWDMATIDTIIQPNPAGGYCVIVKDERYPSYDWITGKTIRVSCAPSLLGPYPEPGPPVSPNFREAPTLIRSPEGREWLLYYEQYAGTGYGLSKALRLEGPWYQVSGNTGVAAWNRYEMPAGVRHGSMIAISRKEHDALVAAFPEGR
ncbi:glycosyl hydrolase family 43 [Sphingomonas sp. BT-65]|uniref:glycosyl hydrolase family 43 n=1 Tax=Sphingomonas sp. BT-65 TaxID=2989821 RepID=UPI0022365E22|nr:glycosyl hydrolase family 43 [Sphingomonas sp. BT-65]MCW4463683.1 glycosyl hydrolase family 43 [Sphingomonas sp. BT-65]